MNFALDLTSKSSPTYRDLLITNGDLVMVSGTSEVLQSILTTLATYYGEWFMDNSIGVDYFNQILVKNPDQAHVDALLIDAILGVPGVVQLLEYTATPDFITRQISVEFSVLSVNGIVDYSGSVAV